MAQLHKRVECKAVQREYQGDGNVLIEVEFGTGRVRVASGWSCGRVSDPRRVYPSATARGGGLKLNIVESNRSPNFSRLAL